MTFRLPILLNQRWSETNGRQANNMREPWKLSTLYKAQKVSSITKKTVVKLHFMTDFQILSQEAGKI